MLRGQRSSRPHLLDSLVDNVLALMLEEAGYAARLLEAPHPQEPIRCSLKAAARFMIR